MAKPNYSLEDHWNSGIAAVIQQRRADVVILQQGPSSLPENQIYLRTWTERLAVPIREAGGLPALLMVWPPSDRIDAFDAVRDAYRNAAEAVDGLFLPAGEAWRAAWRLDPQLGLYGPDGFHPGLLGSFTAALTTYAVVFGERVSDLPLEGVEVARGLDPAAVAIVLEAVDETVGGTPTSSRPDLGMGGVTLARPGFVVGREPERSRSDLER